MNSSAKGKFWERIAEKTMEMVLGLHVYTTERKMVRTEFGFVSNQNDILGCIDHVGIARDQKNWFVQTTCAGVSRQKKEEILALPWNLRHSRVEIWRGVGGRGGRVWDRRFRPGTVELDRWFFQRHRIERGFKPVKGDVIVIPPEVLKAAKERKKLPQCPCGQPMRNELERQIGRCRDCIRGGKAMKGEF